MTKKKDLKITDSALDAVSGLEVPVFYIEAQTNKRIIVLYSRVIDKTHAVKASSCISPFSSWKLMT